MTDRNVSSRHQDPRLGESGPSSGDVLARRLTQVVAGVFIVVGILGFIPGVTTDYDSLQLAGHESEAMLLGIFQVSVLHNVVHLLFGVVGLLRFPPDRGGIDNEDRDAREAEEVRPGVP